METLTANAAVENVMSFFSGNPFATPVGSKIEAATESSLASENWQANMEICDLINTSPDAAKDAVRAIKKRLTNNKNYTVVMYTLTVLETCVKNCNLKFHQLVCSKEFVSELVKIIGPKNDPPTVVQEKVLGLIQSWADVFRSQGPAEVQGVVQIYDDLKYKGIEFPMTDLDSMAPILTPKRSVEAAPLLPTGSESILHPVELGMHQMSQQQIVTPTPEQLTKLRQDMAVVQSNLTVFSEILAEIKKPEQREMILDQQHDQQDEQQRQLTLDLAFLEELYETSKEMQGRIGDLLSSNINSDTLVAELLHLNDDINNCGLRYGRYRKNLEKSDKQEPSLIDFSFETNKASGGGGGGAVPKKTHPPQAADHDLLFDSFAASRGNPPLVKSSPSTYKEVNVPPTSPGSGSAATTLTSSEFDKFLEERAKKS